jgi:hypothetical protein
LRGILNYYSIANNRKRLISRIIYLLWKSCGKTLAVKYKLKRISKVIGRFGKTFKGESGVEFMNVDYKRVKGVKKFKIDVHS